MKILHRNTGAVIFESADDTMLKTVRAAINANANLRSADLRSANLRSADLRSADLSSADLRADLSYADLRSADLRSADLSSANLKENAITQMAPKVEKLHSKVLQAVGMDGNHLEMNDWHKCETTHCRGGWAIALAGEAGRVLEYFTSSDTAARLIYLKSTGDCPDFYASNVDAMKDILACAAKEVA